MPPQSRRDLEGCGAGAAALAAIEGSPAIYRRVWGNFQAELPRSGTAAERSAGFPARVADKNVRPPLFVPHIERKRVDAP